MARKNRSGLTASIIETLRRKGFTQSQIAEMFGVTRQYVSWVRQNYDGVTPTPREDVMQHFPFKGAIFHDSTYDRRLRDHLEYQVTGGDGMSADKLRRLRSFYNKLQSENLVVEFDPDTPAEDGNKPGGYTLRPREKSDGDLIIRVNEHTELTAAGQVLWRFPPKLPI